MERDVSFADTLILADPGPSRDDAVRGCFNADREIQTWGPGPREQLGQIPFGDTNALGKGGLLDAMFGKPPAQGVIVQGCAIHGHTAACATRGPIDRRSRCRSAGVTGQPATAAATMIFSS